MASGTPDSNESPQIREVERLLEGLKQTPTGIVIYDQLVRIVQDWRGAHTKIDQAYYALISFLIDAYNSDPSSDNVTQINAALISARLSGQSGHLQDPVLSSLFEQLGVTGAPSPEPETPQQTEQQAEIETDQAPSEGPENKKKAKNTPPEHLDEEKPAGKDDTYPAVERRVNSAYRLHLDRKHDEIEKLQEILSQKAVEAIAQNKEFGALLQIERAALEQASSVEEIVDLKQILIGGTDELIQGQRTLAEKLHVSLDYLKLVKSDSERLHDELNKVRLLSLTDEITGLPNRRAFMRRLEDEIGRARRYDIPLALAILDLDNFKQVNDKYSHAIGDEVLRWYAMNVLSIFRHHDMVARYGGEEFAVLLPNTNREGVLCALNKVNKRLKTAGDCIINGLKLTPPTFSAGATLYVPTEPVKTLIERSSTLLQQAKQAGRDRIEFGAGQGAQKTEESGSGNGS